MFNNFLSRDDLPLLLVKLRQGYGPRILRWLAVSAARRVHGTWEMTESPPKHWGSLEAIQRRWNFLTTSNPDKTVYSHVANRQLRGKRDLIALSLACGMGAHEVRWAQTGRFARIDGVDLSETRIEQAQERATAADLQNILRFQVGDVRNLDFPPSSYDVVIAFNALHHLAPLAPLVGHIGQLLKPGGLVIVRDYVGPDRFQWTDVQVKAADALLAEIPVRYRVRWRSGEVKKRVLRPGRLLMKLSDPSEAAESSHILPLLEEAFEPVERKDLGGTLLHLVLKDIAHHFAWTEPKAERWLERMMAAEDEFLASSEVGSDFVFGVWRKR